MEIDKQKMMEIEGKFEESRAIEEQLDFVDQQTSELKSFKRSIEDLGLLKGNQILSPLGRGVFVKTSIQEEDLFVDVGAGILIKKNPAETIRVVEEQLQRLGEINFQLSSKIQGLNSEIEDFVNSIEKKEAS